MGRGAGEDELRAASGAVRAATGARGEGRGGRVELGWPGSAGLLAEWAGWLGPGGAGRGAALAGPGVAWLAPRGVFLYFFK